MITITANKRAPPRDLPIGHWSLVIGHSSFVIRHSSFVIRHSSFVISNMLHFHVNLFASSREASFDCAWEDAAERLERMPRMIFEPDGSFVISGNDETGRRWQVDGHLFDFAGRLQRVELRGECPPAAFDDLLGCLGWPRQPLQFELVREGATLTEQEFRQVTT
jgi:hypothetical protein